jgi:hypothetical protein
VRPGFPRFLEYGNRERFATVRLLKLGEPQRRGQTGGAGPDDQDVDVEGLSGHLGC